MIKLSENLVMNAESAKTTAEDFRMMQENIVRDRIEQWLHKVNGEIKDASIRGNTATMVQAMALEDEEALAEQYLTEKGYTITHERLAAWHEITIKW